MWFYFRCHAMQGALMLQAMGLGRWTFDGMDWFPDHSFT
jgi:hypothetical protein